MKTLCFTIKSLTGRYHGEPDWPPSPARLFQALVAVAGSKGPIAGGAKAALEWLELQHAPLIAEPKSVLGQRVKSYVPNNDLDSVGGDPSRIASLRTLKLVQPRILEGDLQYFWPVNDQLDEHLPVLEELAHGVSYFGRGIDQAVLTLKFIEMDETVKERVSRSHRLHHPAAGGSSGITLDLPVGGTLESLIRRHEAQSKRFQRGGKRVIFKQPPRPYFGSIRYGVPPQTFLYELRKVEDATKFNSWHEPKIVELTSKIRDLAVQKLVNAMPEREGEVKSSLVGAGPNNNINSTPAERVRIVPLPSIGHEHTAAGIRRILVEVPGVAKISAADVDWAFSGLELEKEETILLKSTETSMLRHFGVDGQHRKWQTVTPVAISHGKGKSRLERESEAAKRLLASFRHSDISVRPLEIQVQREPFLSQGKLASEYATDRFTADRLWHVEMTFLEPVEGPLQLGDGRFLGLGTFAPVRDFHPGVYAFDVEGVVGLNGEHGAHALRRALMSRLNLSRDKSTEPFGRFVTGHQGDSSPDDSHAHLAYAYDPELKRMFIISPSFNLGTGEQRYRDFLNRVDTAISGFNELRTSMGVLAMAHIGADLEGPHFGCFKIWRTVTPYVAMRHARGVLPSEMIEAEIFESLVTKNLRPESITVSNVKGVKGVGVTADVELKFAKPQRGPFLLGRTRYKGGGFFRGG